MHKYIVLLFSFIGLIWQPNSCLEAKEDYSIVFIHIGDKIPSYTKIAIEQARVFNPDCPIILLANKSALNNYSLKDNKANITFVSCESLSKTAHHKEFIKRIKWKKGFWRYTSERFLYLCDLMTQHNLKNVFHLEYDNMLYADLRELLPIFNLHYQGMAATFDNDQRCIAGFIFVPNQQVVQRLAKYFADHAHEGFNDMEVLAKFKKQYGEKWIDNLPITTKQYANDHLLITPTGYQAEKKELYYKNLEIFNSIFDAAALGQYLGGIDPNNGPSIPGFINESCVFNPSLFIYEWIYDNEGRKIPYILYSGEKYRINNLHIHCKNLRLFSSK